MPGYLALAPKGRAVGPVIRRSVGMGFAITLLVAACSPAATVDEPATSAAQSGTPGPSPDSSADPTTAPLPEADASVTLYSSYIRQPRAVAAGSTVLVLNNGKAPHDWVNRDGAAATRRLKPGEWELVTFDAPGTYLMVCTLHPVAMRDKLVVTDGPVPAELLEEDDGKVHVDLVEHDFVGPTEFTAGTEITVTNIGAVEHNLVDPNGSFGTQILAPGESEVVVLNTPGRYEFQCTLHRGMDRAVTVI